MTVTVEFASAAPAIPAPTRAGAGRAMAGRPAAASPVTPSRLTPSRRPVPARRPARSRVVAGGPSCATPTPQPIAASSAVQLTRRGWTVLLSAATAVAAVLVWIAALSHPATSAGSREATGGTAAGVRASQVVVQPGDTLWSIASRVAPGRDPRAVVYDLQQANHLPDSTVREGQVLRVG